MEYLQRFKALKAKLTHFDRVVIAMSLVYSLVFSLICLYRYRNFMFYIDLGAHTQALYTTAFYGMPLYETFDTINSIKFSGLPYYGSYLGLHFSPILFLLVPIFSIIPCAEMLLVVKSLAIGLSVIPAYYLAKNILEEKLALLASILYLIHPALHTLNLADFQATAFFPLLMFSSVYFLRKKNYVLYYTTLLLSLMTNEFISILIGLYAIIEFLTNRDKPEGSFTKKHFGITIFLAFGWYALASVLMPLFKPRVFGAWSADLFNSLTYHFSEKILFLLAMFAPFGFLPLKSPFILSLLPYLGATMFSTFSGNFRVGWHYGSYYLPLLFIALVDSLDVFNWNLRSLKRRGMLLFILSCITFSFLITPLNPITIGNITGIAYDPKIFSDEHIDKIYRVFEIIPPNASILVQTPLSQHLATRLNCYIYADIEEFEILNVSYVLSDNIHHDFKYYNFDRLLFYALKNGYGILAHDDGIILLEKDYNDQPIIYEPPKMSFGYEDLYVHNGEVLKEEELLVHEKGMDEGTFWFGPYVTLLPLNYTVSYQLKIEKLTPEKVIVLDVLDGEKLEVLSSLVLKGIDFKKADTWQNFTISFSLEELSSKMEFRGVDVSNNVTIYFRSVTVEGV